MISYTENNRSINHLITLQRLAQNSNHLVLVSPFLSEDISSILDEMPSIKKVDIYTNFDGYGMAIKIISAIDNIFKSDRKVTIKTNEFLHGKVYCFYKDEKERGFVITSGNFTEKGLKHNYEFGVCIKDAEQQKKIINKIKHISWKEISPNEIEKIKEAAYRFSAENPTQKQEIFKALKYFDKVARTRDDFEEAMILLNVNKKYKEGMSAGELYKITRGHWFVKLKRANSIPYVAAVVGDKIKKIKEVYKIKEWVPALTYTDEKDYEKVDPNRKEFAGEVAEKSIREKYVGMDVTGVYNKQQNAIAYVGEMK